MNIPLAEFQIGCKLSVEDILSSFVGNICRISENKLFVVDFISFQYGELKENCIPHRNVFNLLEKHNIQYPIDRVLYTLMDKDKDKDKEDLLVQITPESSKPLESKKRAKKEFSPPTEIDVIEYFKSNGFSEESAKRFFNSYSVANWYDSRGNPVRNWKQKAQMVWFKDENRIKNTPEQPKPLAHRMLV